MGGLFADNENFQTGYVKIFRSAREHYLFKEKLPFSKFEAWIDILLKVNYDAKKITIKNEVFTVNRGESLRSLDTWADGWRWDKSKVRRFFDLLQKENMIELKNEQKTTRLTVCNYDSYQCFGNAYETQMKRKRNGVDTQTTPNNEVKKIINFNIDIKDRKVSFKKELQTFSSEFDKAMINDFYIYWSETDKANKMRFEKEKTWETNLRLQRWKKNNNDSAKQETGFFETFDKFKNA